MRIREVGPYVALGALALALVVLIAIPQGRAWVGDTVLDPLHAQADPAARGTASYSVGSLLFWATIGGVLAWVAYDLAFVRAGFETDRSFFLALAPALVLGPLLHAALAAGVFPPASLPAYLASEPVVYVTAALFAAVGLALGRLARRPIALPLAWGALGLAPLLIAMLPRVDPEGARIAVFPLALALGASLALAWAFTRVRKGEPFGVAAAVIGGHALDGATTWMLLRPETFGLPSVGFGEKNPLSESLILMGNGWPFFAVKLALPVVLLALVKREESEARMRAFLLFAVFVLGFGPGMSNLLQVIFL